MPKILKTFAGVRTGQKFKVVSNSNSHNYPIGKLLTFKRDGVHGSQMHDCAEGITGNTLDIRDVRMAFEKLEELHERVVELQNEMNDVKAKIKVCNDLGLTEYDDNVIKVHKALEIIKTKTTDIEKAQVIASLITEGE